MRTQATALALALLAAGQHVESLIRGSTATDNLISYKTPPWFVTQCDESLKNMSATSGGLNKTSTADDKRWRTLGSIRTIDLPLMIK